MGYSEIGEVLGREYSSRETVKVMSYITFQTINEAVEYIKSLAKDVNIEIPNDLFKDENFTEFMIGFHNGTILSGNYSPEDGKMM